ncbi:MAG: phosphoglycerate dehydrogenase [Minwuia sp.]|uniref:phosphoglycerate dehydrogenase n=1 Tax=Minwuia sp. TaxID=2493630 RepID=UPI003A882937
MPKVLISDKMSPLAAETFRARGVEVDEKVGLSKEELIAIIGEYDGLAVRSATKVTADVLNAATNLKVIGRAGIGVDNVDVNAATAAGVCVMNTPFGNSITTAEHAIAMMMALARQIPQADASTQAGKWEKSKFMGVEVTGKTLGVIGCGNIGAIVVSRAQGLKMKVIAADPFLSEARATELGVDKVELPELYARADFITLHTPMTDQTRNLINAEALAQMKDGVRIVNCARGGLIVEDDLKAALDSGKVAGAALDVFSTEPAKENVLFGHPEVITTPHLGASTNEAQVNVALQVAEQMADFLIDGAVSNALNMASVTAEEAPRLKPYQKLADQLGAFMGQTVKSGLKSVRVSYQGRVAHLNVKPLTAIVLQGLLKPMMDSINMVNAPVMASERGIQIVEERDERPGDYQTAIRVFVETENGTRCIGGTLFAGDLPRVIEIDTINMEAEIGEHMLFVRNHDKPGFIGKLGTILGDAGVNIGTFHLGRANGNAVAFIQVDEAVSPKVLKQVTGLTEYVQRADALSF